MTKKWYLIFLIPFIIGCSFLSDTKELNLKSFTITVPKDWNYVNQQGIDSFVGEIKGPQVLLSFDCSGMGYANHLLLTEQEYLKSRDWWDHSTDFPYWGTKTNVAIPDRLQKNKFPKADFIATLTYQGKTIYAPIEIPAEIKTSNIQLDSNDNYVFKTIWPKIAGKGMTGIYIHSRKSTFNFQMAAENLSAVDQELALQAFKTIKFAK